MRDETAQIMERAKNTARQIYGEASSAVDSKLQEEIAKHARVSQKLERLSAMIRLAQSIPAIIVRGKDLDSNPMLLAVRNGVVDLTTGTLRDPNPDDYITRQAPVTFDPEAACPTFLAFLQAIFDGDKDLVDYMQRVLGYCLTGDTSEQCMFFFYGFGANGKSTLLNVIKEMLGPDYCKQTPSDTLMAGAAGAVRNDIARLDGVRVVLSNEVEEGSRLSETTIKQLTGNDPVAARFLYKEYFEYTPRFKIIMAGNHQPVVRGDDTGIWRRLQTVPFDVTIPQAQRDPALPDKLRAELPGILNFAVQGCLGWRSSRLSPPRAIQEALEEYRSDMDILGQWIDENCTADPQAQLSAAAAYADYRTWAQLQGHFVWSANAFGRKLVRRHQRRKTRDGSFYVGLALKPRGLHAQAAPANRQGDDQ